MDQTIRPNADGFCASARSSRPRRSLLIAAMTLPVGGCAGVLDPQGPIGQSERLVLIDSVAIMLAIVIPVIIATIAFAWWFRASNTRATYRPYWAFSGRLELIVWAIPTLVIMFLGGIAWFGSHALDPWNPIESKSKPLEVEVVSLDWKWLFIYPDKGLASVNQLVIPAGTPIHFKLTAATVMNSFFVPQLGSQIYTMAGMTTQLNLQADRPGRYHGLSAQFSGEGFSDMDFEVRALPSAEFDDWAKDAQKGAPTLDPAAFGSLTASKIAPAFTYKDVKPGLFDSFVNQTAPMLASGSPGTPKPSGAAPQKGT